MPREPQASSPHQPQPSHLGGPSIQHHHTPGQCSLHLQPSHQGDTGTKHPRTLQACTTLASDGVAKVPLIQSAPTHASFGSGHPNSTPTTLNTPEPQSMPASVPAALPGHPLHGMTQEPTAHTPPCLHPPHQDVPCVECPATSWPTLTLAPPGHPLMLSTPESPSLHPLQL